jgi:hypothetical protein
VHFPFEALTACSPGPTGGRPGFPLSKASACCSCIGIVTIVEICRF